MRKVFHSVSLAVALALLAGIFFFFSSGPGRWVVDREKGFIGGLGNSLCALDQAKQQWATEKNKSEQDIPTLEDLMPYLGDYRVAIKRFMALGIDYKITSLETNQSDVATLTRDLRFRCGYCLFYPAGTTYCVHTGWTSPPRNTAPKSFNTLYFENNLDHRLEAALAILVVGNLLVFLNRKKRIIQEDATGIVSVSGDEQSNA